MKNGKNIEIENPENGKQIGKKNSKKDTVVPLEENGMELYAIKILKITRQNLK